MAPSIPLPDAKMRLRDQGDIELNSGHPWTTWKEWYGDLSQLFHCFVHMPVFDFCQRRIKSRIVELDYDKAKEMFYEEDKKFWDEAQELINDQQGRDIVEENEISYADAVKNLEQARLAFRELNVYRVKE